MCLREFLCIAGVAAFVLQVATSKGTGKANKKEHAPVSYTQTYSILGTSNKTADHDEVSVFLQRSAYLCGLQGQTSMLVSACCCSAQRSPTPALCGGIGGLGTSHTLVRLQTPGTWFLVTATPSLR